MTKEKALHAGLWSALDLALRQGFQFLVAIVLARLLTPAEFGTAALVGFFASLSIVFVQGGLSTALIQRQQTSHAEESSLFWLNLGASAVFAAGVVAISPAVARFYGQSVIIPLMAIAGLQIVSAALGSVHAALLTRQLRFDQLTKSGVAASLAAGSCGIGAALVGAGVYALVIQLAVLALVNSLILWAVNPWRPARRFRLADLRELYRFGFALSLSSTLEVVYSQGFTLVLGKLHGIREVGLYNRAQSTQLLPSNVIGSIVGRVAMPVFAGRSGDLDALRRGVRLANGLTMLVNMPTMTGLILLSDLVIVTLFGDQWLEAAPVLSILALGGIFYPLQIINLQTLLAQGRADLFLRLEIAKKIVGVAILVVGSLFGLMGLAWSQAIFSLVALAINTWPIGRSLGYGAPSQLKDLGGVLVAATIMAATILLVRPLLSMGPQLNLLILGGLGTAVYVAAGMVLRVDHFHEALRLIRQMLRGIRMPNSADPRILE